MIDSLIKLIIILKPKFYNRLAWLVVISGISLLGSPLLERIINALLNANYNITITDKNDAYIGIILIIVGLIYHMATHYLTEVRKIDTQEQQKLKAKKSLLLAVRIQLSSQPFDSNRFRESLNYSRIRPFLNKKLIDSIEGETIMVQTGGRGGGVNNFESAIYDECSRLEKEWDLI